ncbi:MAG: hypothetical protein V4596_11980 [Bdellovibrionota bacterium]
MSQTYRLSKTLYCKGKNCAKALWLHFHKPEAQDPIDSYRKRLFDYGHGVGKRATESFPNGVLIDVPREEGALALAETKKALGKNPPAIFEGAFLHNDVLVRVDILENNNDGTWNLIEVKSSSNVKPNPHYDDVAIQKWVLDGSGIQIQKSYIMIPTRGFSPKGKLDSTGKFVMYALDSDIVSHSNQIAENIKTYQAKLNTTSEPIERTGERCKRPYLCEFKTYCWKQNKNKH